jgi:hypothetical protein
MPVYASDTEFLDHDDAEGTDVFSLPVRHTSTAALISSKDHILPGGLLSGASTPHMGSPPPFVVRSG